MPLGDQPPNGQWPGNDHQGFHQGFGQLAPVKRHIATPAVLVGKVGYGQHHQ